MRLHSPAPLRWNINNQPEDSTLYRSDRMEQQQQIEMLLRAVARLKMEQHRLIWSAVRQDILIEGTNTLS